MASRRKFRRKQAQAGPAGLVLCLVFVVCAVFLLMSKVFVVKRVAVTGNVQVEDADVVTLSGIRLGESIFQIDRTRVFRAFDREGAYRLANVNVSWPDTVELVVLERVPVAVVESLGTSLVVDAEGVVMKRLSELPGDAMPVVTGLAVSQSLVGQPVVSQVSGQVEAMSSVLGTMASQGLGAMVSELNVRDLDNLYLMTRGGMMVTLGDSSNMENKFLWMQSVLTDLAQQGKTTGTLDVTSGQNSAYYSPY